MDIVLNIGGSVYVASESVVSNLILLLLLLCCAFGLAVLALRIVCNVVLDMDVVVVASLCLLVLDLDCIDSEVFSLLLILFEGCGVDALARASSKSD